MREPKIADGCYVVAVLLAATLAASAVFGQQQPAPPTERELQGRMSMLASQRDEANNRIAFIAGQLEELKAQMAKMESTCKQPAAEKK